MDPNDFPNEDPKTTEPICQEQRDGECKAPAYLADGEWKILQREDVFCLAAAARKPERRQQLAKMEILTVKQVAASKVGRVCERDPWDRGKLMCDPLPGSSGDTPRGTFIGNLPPTDTIPTGCSRYGRDEMICQKNPDQSPPFRIPNGTYDASKRLGAGGDPSTARRVVAVRNNVLMTSDQGTFRFLYIGSTPGGGIFLITDKRASDGSWQPLSQSLRMLVIQNNNNFPGYTVWFGNGQIGFPLPPTEYWLVAN